MAEGLEQGLAFEVNVQIVVFGVPLEVVMVVVLGGLRGVDGRGRLLPVETQVHVRVHAAEAGYEDSQRTKNGGPAFG